MQGNNVGTFKKLIQRYIFSIQSFDLVRIIADYMRLKAIQEEQGGSTKTSKINQLFSSHPDLDARIKRMQERADADNCPE